MCVTDQCTKTAKAQHPSHAILAIEGGGIRWVALYRIIDSTEDSAGD